MSFTSSGAFCSPAYLAVNSSCVEVGRMSSGRSRSHALKSDPMVLTSYSSSSRKRSISYSGQLSVLRNQSCHDTALTLIEASLPKTNFTLTSRHTIQSLDLRAVEVQVAGCRQSLPSILFLFSTHSIHLHGSAGIQNSVLSFESSRRFAIRVTRVCSANGKLITLIS